MSMTFVQGLIIGGVIGTFFGFMLGAVAVALKLALSTEGDGRNPRVPLPASGQPHQG